VQCGVGKNGERCKQNTENNEGGKNMIGITYCYFSARFRRDKHNHSCLILHLGFLNRLAHSVMAVV
jgi:hypothetical protein